ncbi:hypothetical protein BDF19DRAFT_414478 [Syncephalis fuscata]|nr:hypothetical protein BDF19DRAFT_414478 [Syncephalis fuscata]
MQLKQAESKAMAQEAAVQEQEQEADNMQIDLPPSYHDAVAAVIGTKSTEERALPPLPSSAPAMGWPASSSSSSLSSVGQVLHWQLENLQQSKIRLGLFDPSRGVQYPVIRAPLERVSGLSFAGVWDQTQMSLRHLKRCAVHIHTPSVSMHPHPVQCQLNNISRCSIDLTGEQSYLFVGLQLSSIKGSRVALGPAQGSVRLSKISKTTLIRSPTAAPPASLVYNASAVNLQGPSIFHAEKLSRCTLDLRSPATSTQQTAPFTKVILSRLSRCVVYLDYVPGSISLDKCKRCIVVIPGQQMTFRKCSRVRAYILPSTVISTERTRRIQLTPLSGNTYREYQVSLAIYTIN